MDDVYLISLAKTEYREGYNTANADRVLSVFAESFTNMSDGDCSFFGEEGKRALREQLEGLFSAFRVQMFPIIIDIVPKGDAAFDWGWHKVILEPKNGGEVQRLKVRYYETWARQPDGNWKIDFLITNREHTPRMLGELQGKACRITL